MPPAVYFDGPNRRSNRSRILIVEGEDDAKFFDHLLSDINADPDRVGIVYIRGKDNLLENLKLLAKSPSYVKGEIAKIAIVRDSDENPQAQLQSINSVMRAIGWPNFESLGFKTQGNTSYGVFLLPETEPGDLERVCLDTISGHKKLGLVREFYDNIIESFGALDRPYKRQASIFLACSSVETRGVGSAFALGLFDKNHESLGNLRNFLTELVV